MVEHSHLTQTNLEHLFLSLRSRRKHKAWGASPRIFMQQVSSPRSGRQRWRPFHGLKYFSFYDPGAHAPGFMLTPASQAKSLLFLRARRLLKAPLNR